MRDLVYERLQHRLRIFAPKKASVLKEWADNPFPKKDDLIVWIGENATILPLKQFPEDNLCFGRAGVVDSAGGYIALSSIPDRVEFSYPVDHPERREERVVYCGYLAKQWGHFLIESVARLWYALENSASYDRLIFVTEDGAPCHIGGNYKAFLELLGLYDKVEILNKPVTFKEVLVPQVAYQRRRFYTDRFNSIFDRIISNVPVPEGWSGADKVFLSRSHLKNIRKSEYGHDLLDHYFERNGYRVVYPETMSLSELILLLTHCSECASVSGTLPHNMLFAPNGCKLTILERNVLNNEIQLDINIMKALHVTCVDANIPIYPVSVGYGPIIMAYNDYLSKYTQDHHYRKPDASYTSRQYLKKCFVSYMKAYQKAYRYQWYMADWMLPYNDYLYEGYCDCLKYFGDYLYGKKPFLPTHYFMPHYWKQVVKWLLKALRK